MSNPRPSAHPLKLGKGNRVSAPYTAPPVKAETAAEKKARLKAEKETEKEES